MTTDSAEAEALDAFFAHPQALEKLAMIAAMTFPEAKDQDNYAEYFFETLHNYSGAQLREVLSGFVSGDDSEQDVARATVKAVLAHEPGIVVTNLSLLTDRFRCVLENVTTIASNNETWARDVMLYFVAAARSERYLHDTFPGRPYDPEIDGPLSFADKTPSSSE